MNNNKPYEISVWEDVLGYEVEEKRIVDPDGEHSGAQSKTGIEIEGQTYGINMGANAGYLSLEKNENGTSLVYTEINEVAHKAELDLENYEVVDCLVKERKIGIIGSSSMTAQHRAMNGKLVSNVNGSNTLTFSMYHKYYDNESGEYVENPFIKLLTNERRVKLRLGNPGDADVEWYDFVIKNVQESSDSKVFNYTCTDLFINELSKNGYNITLDGELENNIGTPDELAEFVLAGTDWKLGESDLIHTYNEEPVYRIAFSSEVVLTPVSQKAGDPKKFTLPANAGALVFYSSLMAREKEIQILCALDKDGNIDPYERDSNGEILKDSENNPIVAGPSRKWVMDEDGRVVASEHTNNPKARQFIVPVTFTEGNVLPNEVASKDFNTNNMDLRGRRIVRAQETKYDTNLGKYVSRYTKKDDPEGVYWCFAESDKSELTVLNNYVTNSSTFENTSGWEVLTKELDDETKVSFASSYTSGLVEVDENGDFKNKNLDDLIKSWIRMDFGSSKTIGNTGLWDYLYDYDKITKGDTFILGTIYDSVTWTQTNGKDDYTKSPTVGKATEFPHHSIKFFESKWTNGVEVADIQPLDTAKVVGSDEADKYVNWHFQAFTFNKDISHKELVEGELRLCFDKGASATYYLREAMLFKKYLVRDVQEEANGQQMDITEVVYDESEATRYLLPGKFTNRPLSFPEYKIYLDGTSEGQDLDSMKYLLETKDITVLEQSYTPYYDPKAAARVQVTAKESNRFNILQDIAEAAQCWVKFSIKHNAHTGHIEMDEEKKPIKQVSFHQFAGKNNSAGFKYGINLKSIQRTIESNQLTSKLIVKPNSNEFADAKQCAIGKAQSNPTKEDIIYNLNYYINHGMIDYETWMDDMYGQTESDGKICYQKKMKEIVKNYDKISEQVVYYSNLLNKLESECTVYKEARDAAVVARRNALEAITDYCNKYTYNEYVDLVKGGVIEILIKNGDKEEKKQEPSPTTTQGLKTFCTLNSFQFAKESRESYFVHYVADKMIEIDTLSEKIYNYDVVLKDDPEVYPDAEDRATGLVASLEKTKEEYKNLKNELKKIKAAREELENLLFSRYGRFIQEGTWISEDYFDNELYYLEAVNVSNTSAFPQVSYTINVIDVSRVEDYENITFAVGDKSYIQDTEFFGWKMVDKTHKTPYKEEVICSEVARVLDDGSQNTIKVQNYKNQFEDLFQRINATTQQVQYKSGEYQKAANAFTEDGELQNGLLSAALERNTAIMKNATNESTWMDNTGINSRNGSQPNLWTRIVGGAIAVSNDGGNTWGNAITGDGINANYLCAGTIDAGIINIRSGKEAAFTWDVKGISAYASRYKDANGVIQDLEHFDPSTFVRFDQFGIYGVQNDSNFFAKSNTDININNGVIPFALTWEGFFFRTGEVGTGVTIDSINDLCVVNDKKIRVKIGKISDDGEYGIRIYNNKEEPVISQDSNGNLIVTGHINATSLNLGDATIPTKNVAGLDSTVAGLNGQISGLSGDIDELDEKVQENTKNVNELNTKFENFDKDYIKTDDLSISSITDKDGNKITTITLNGESSEVITSADGSYVLTNVGLGTPEGGENGDQPYFKVDKNGLLTAYNVLVYGTVYANLGRIGGWEIGANGLVSYNSSPKGKVGMSSNASYPAFWAGSSKQCFEWEAPHSWSSDMKFYVTHDGHLHSTSGNIGGWNVTSSYIDSSSGKKRLFLASALDVTDRWINATDSNGKNTFSVFKSGKLYASGAEIDGVLTASSGSKIANWNIDTNSIYNCTDYSKWHLGTFMSTGSNGSYSIGGSPNTIGSWVFGAGGNFGVTKDGAIWCSKLNVTGAHFQVNTISGSGQVGQGNFYVGATNSVTDDFSFQFGVITKTYVGSSLYTGIDISKEGGLLFGPWSIGNMVFYHPGSGKRSQIYANGWGIDFGIDGQYHDLLGSWYVKKSLQIVPGATLKNQDGGIEISSDLRMKNSIVAPKDNYEIFFDNLSPVVFKYNSSTSDRFHSGFIAQQVVASLQAAGLSTQDFAGVCQDDTNDPESQWYLRYEEFVSLNTWQIQKLKSRVSELEAKIAQLEAKI